jgi:peptidyl-dipeptidase Dcp
MAKTPENVDNFLNKLMAAATPVAQKELAEMQALSDAEGNNFKLASWDWWYYAEKLRKQKYDLDQNELKPYFSLQTVRNGMFAVATRLYGISFKRVDNLPVYHKDVETYQVNDTDGSHLGILYLDYFPRPSKDGGAWCTDFRSAGFEDGKKVDPIISIVCNFTPPSGDAPSLLNWDETETLFHEFGHALHGLFTEGKYTRTAGIVPTDYVELPSQIMENWASEPEVLRMYAKHYETGEVIPEELITKIQNSGLFNQGFDNSEYIAASILDMELHKLPAPAEIADLVAFEQETMAKTGLMSEIWPRYRSTYFAHIFDGGYAAGYYVYLWAAVLDADAFAYFKESGDLFNQELAADFRKHCLTECGDDEGMTQYVKFRKQEPTIDALLAKRGLN